LDSFGKVAGYLKRIIIVGISISWMLSLNWVRGHTDSY